MSISPGHNTVVQQPCASCSHTCVSVTKQYNLVLVKARAETGTPRNALAPYPRCLAQGYRNGDQCRPMAREGLYIFKDQFLFGNSWINFFAP